MKDIIIELFEFSKGLDIKHTIDDLTLHHTYNPMLKRHSFYVYEKDNTGKEFSCLISEYNNKKIYGFIHPEYCGENNTLKSLLEHLDGKGSIGLEIASKEQADLLFEKSKSISVFYGVNITHNYLFLKDNGDKEIFFPDGKIVSDMKKFMIKYNVIAPESVIWNGNFKEFSIKDTDEFYDCADLKKLNKNNPIFVSLGIALRNFLFEHIKTETFQKQFENHFSYTLKFMNKKEIMNKKRSIIDSILTKNKLFGDESLSSLEKRFYLSLDDVAEFSLMQYLNK